MAKKFIASNLSLDLALAVCSFDAQMAFVRIREIKKKNMPRVYESLIQDPKVAKEVSDLFEKEVPCCTVPPKVLLRDFVYVVKEVNGTVRYFEITFDDGGCGDCESDNCYGCGLVSWMHGY